MKRSIFPHDLSGFFDLTDYVDIINDPIFGPGMTDKNGNPRMFRVVLDKKYLKPLLQMIQKKINTKSRKRIIRE